MKRLMNEELNIVVGGSVEETVEDGVLLCEGKYIPEAFSFFHMMFHWCSDSAKVDHGWAIAGVRSVTKFIGPNEYYANGKKIDREDAIYYL